VAGKEIAVKKYVVRLSAEERERLEALVHSGKSLAQLLTRAAHSPQGRRVGGGRRLERQRDRGGAGHEHQQCRSHSVTTRRGGVRGDAEAQIQSELARPRIFEGAAEAFPAPEARRLANRFEWHYTPKHGSWLDMAESELAVLTSQCLSRRIPDKPTLEKEVAAWERHRNKHHA